VPGGIVVPNKYPFSAPPPGPSVNFGNFEPFSLNIIDPNYAVPYLVSYNLTIQRELPGQMILSVGYVGSQGRHLERVEEQNVGTNAAGCAADPACVANRLVESLASPQFFRYGFAGTPNAGIYGSLGQQQTDGNSQYNSLQASLNKRISHGLTFLLSYTYAHSRDNGSGFERTGAIPTSTRVSASLPATPTRSRFPIL
jgi:hypothetical protein